MSYSDAPGLSGKDRCYKFVAQTWLTPEDYAEPLATNPDKEDMDEETSYHFNRIFPNHISTQCLRVFDFPKLFRFQKSIIPIFAHQINR